MNPLDPACLLWAPVISWIVELLKRVPFIPRYPKVIAALISLAVTYFTGPGASPGHALPVSQLVVCVLVMLGGSIAVHEVTPDSIARTLNGGSGER